MLKGHRTKITAITFAVYNVAVAFWPRLGQMVDPATVNSVIMGAMAWFLRDSIPKE